MKKRNFLKAANYLSIIVVAIVCYACPDSGTESNPFNTVTTYNTAVGYYYGDLAQNGTAVFIVDMYDASDDNIGVWINGFTTLPSGFGSFKLNTGTYSMASTFAQNTYLKGDTVSGKLAGTYVYNYDTQVFTLITGGTFDVTSDGNNYTISTNFTGKEIGSEKTVSNLQYKFTGTIAFSDKSSSSTSTNLSFSDISKSNYTATGTPGFLVTPGPTTWTGQITPSTGTSQYYTISGWGGQSLNVFCDFNNGKVVIDDTTMVAHDNTGYSGYFMVIAIDNNAKTYYLIDDDYFVAYDKTNKILDFSGKYNDLPVYVGVGALSDNTGDLAGAFTDFYANAKLKLTATTQSSSSATTKVMTLSYSESISPEQLKNFRMGEKVELKKSPDNLFNRFIPIVKE